MQIYCSIPHWFSAPRTIVSTQFGIVKGKIPSIITNDPQWSRKSTRILKESGASAETVPDLFMQRGRKMGVGGGVGRERHVNANGVAGVVTACTSNPVDLKWGQLKWLGSIGSLSYNATWGRHLTRSLSHVSSIQSWFDFNSVWIHSIYLRHIIVNRWFHHRHRQQSAGDPFGTLRSFFVCSFVCFLVEFNRPIYWASIAFLFIYLIIHLFILYCYDFISPVFDSADISRIEIAVALIFIRRICVNNKTTTGGQLPIGWRPICNWFEIDLLNRRAKTEKWNIKRHIQRIGKRQTRLVVWRKWRPKMKPFFAKKKENVVDVDCLLALPFPIGVRRVDCVEEVPHRNWRKPEAQLRSSFLLHVQVDNKLGWKPSFYFTFQLALFAGSIFPLWFLPIQISLRNGSRLQVHLECPVQLTGRSSHCSLQFTIKTRC